ncbi:MAG: porin family protein [Saprospiraceae bacterium]
MRIRLLLLLLAQSITFLGFAQGEFEPETSIGLKLGPNISNVNFAPTIAQNLNYGYLAGITFKHIQEKNLGIQLELNYLQAGWNEIVESTQTYSRRLNYLQFPLMTHLNFGKKKLRFFINVGPYLAYLTSNSETIKNISEEQFKSHYNKVIVNEIETGFCLGLGLTQLTNFGIFQLEFRGNTGLINLFEETIGTPFKSAKNLTAEVTLSYSLAIKR